VVFLVLSRAAAEQKSSEFRAILGPQLTFTQPPDLGRIPPAKNRRQGGRAPKAIVLPCFPASGASKKMKLPVAIVVTIAACAGIVAATTLWAQQAPPAAPRNPVALINLDEIMKNSTRFKQAMDKLKVEYEAEAKALQERADRGNKMVQELRAMQPADPARKPLEQKILSERADYDLEQKRLTSDVGEKESKIVLGLVADVKGELERFARARQVDLILRYDPQVPNLDDPRMIMQEIHKPIVYQAGLEATGPVLTTMNLAAGAPAARTGAAPVSRPPAR
jgi:Skp family chaperone for outer membrane proteins